MQPEDRKKFENALRDNFELAGAEPPSKTIFIKFWKLFEDWTIEQFVYAINEHERRSGFRVKPADLFAIKKQLSGMPTADEAWAIALQSYDENNTVVWTQQIANAYSASYEILAAGDKVGARMAFRSAYERECELDESLTWIVSLGHDPARRADAVHQAVTEGLLTDEAAQRYLPDNSPAGPIAGLLTGNVVEFPQAEDIKNKLAGLRNIIKKPQDSFESVEISEEEEELAIKRMVDALDRENGCK